MKITSQTVRTKALKPKALKVKHSVEQHIDVKKHFFLEQERVVSYFPP